MDTDSKLRPLYLLKILKELTDENHALSTTQLCEILKDEFGIDTFRTTLKSDVEILQKAGFTIGVTRSAQNMYHWAEPDFAPADLAILIDIVKSSRLIEQSRKEALAFQLAAQAGPNHENLLHRTQIRNSHRYPDSGQVQDAIMIIQEAIRSRIKIRFQLAAFNVRREKTPLRVGEYCVLSPYSVVCDGERYYVIGFSDSNQSMETYRLDRMLRCPEKLADKAVPIPCDFDISAFYRAEFCMDGSVPEEVELQVDNSLMDAMIDRFGEDVVTYACDQNSFRLVAEVFPSADFFGWVFGFRGKVTIRRPEYVRKKYETIVREAEKPLERI